MGTTTIVGEKYVRYVLVTDTRDGGSSLQLLPVYTRVVCANTLSAAFREDTESKIRLQHSSTIATDFAFSLDLMDMAEKQSSLIKVALESLAQVQVPRADLDGIWDVVYPLPRRGTLLNNYSKLDDPSSLTEVQTARMSSLEDQYQAQRRLCLATRDAATTRYDVLRAEYPIHKDTALGVYQTVAEIADHTRNNRKDSASAALIGYRADEKNRAFRHLYYDVGGLGNN
jgi:hypothetical protein